MRMLFWIVVPLLFLVVIVFAVKNYETVDVSLWPAWNEPFKVPIYAVALLGVFLGFLWGGATAWVQGARGRERRRALARRLESERQQVAVLRQRLAKLESAEKQATIPSPPASVA
jgi:uncharacterized integral membrane protein